MYCKTYLSLILSFIIYYHVAVSTSHWYQRQPNNCWWKAQEQIRRRNFSSINAAKNTNGKSTWSWYYCNMFFSLSPLYFFILRWMNKAIIINKRHVKNLSVIVRVNGRIIADIQNCQVHGLPIRVQAFGAELQVSRLDLQISRYFRKMICIVQILHLWMHGLRFRTEHFLFFSNSSQSDKEWFREWW